MEGEEGGRVGREKREGEEGGRGGREKSIITCTCTLLVPYVSVTVAKETAKYVDGKDT